MTPEDRDQMIELCRRIARETNPKELAVWIEDLNGLIQNRIRELRDAGKSMTNNSKYGATLESGKSDTVQS